MKANKSDLREVIEGAKQYVLPLYQRRYSWRKKNWQTLKRDLDRLIQDGTLRSHFVGSLVTVPYEHAAEQNVVRYRLIDGQQRLTTILLLLCALRDVAATRGEQQLADEVHGRFLSNLYSKGEAEQKLVPLQEDAGEFHAVSRRPAHIEAGRIGEAYSFFANWFSEMSVDELQTAKHAALGRLDVVNITLEHGDDPHLIFESLNAKGERLTQADLLRNYFLMRLPPPEADALYLQYWKPMQDQLGEHLTSFFRHYLMRDPSGAQVRRDEVYDHVKAKIDYEARTPRDVTPALEDLCRHARHYAGLVYPALYEPYPDTASKIGRLHRLKVTTAYPFLLNVMRSIDDERLSPPMFSRTLELIETFLIRRAVVGIPTNQLRVIFRGLLKDAAAASADDQYLFAVRENLSFNQRCPTDSLFRDALVHRPLYVGNKYDLPRLLLERIETSYEHKEAVNPSGPAFQVEHVMPQTLTDEWREMICPQDPAACDEVHDKWLHTLGNLTLTGYNATLSNKTFWLKKVEFAESKFTLNGHFANAGEWTATEIEHRARLLADEAVDIWPEFATPRSLKTEERRRRQRVPAPIAFTIEGVRTPVTSNLDATHQILQAFHSRNPVLTERALRKLFRRDRVGFTSEGMRAPRGVGPLFLDLHGSGGWLQERVRKFLRAIDQPVHAVEYEYQQ